MTDQPPRSGQGPDAPMDEQIVPPGTAPSRPDAPDPHAGEDVTLELDADVIAWFRERGEGVEMAINAVLREHIGRQRNAP